MTTRSFIVLYCSIIFLALYEAPTGMSYGGASFLILLFHLVYITFRKKCPITVLKSFMLTFMIFLITCAIIFSILAMTQSANPIERALEFIDICSSTNYWTYETLGKSDSRVYSLLYSVLPIVCIFGLLFCVKKFNTGLLYISATAMFGAYFLNYTRMLGRHSLIENQYQMTVWTAFFGIMILFATLKPGLKKLYFAFGGIVLIVFLGVTDLSRYRSNLYHAFNKATNTGIYYKGANRKITRVNMSAPFEKHSAVIKMINNIIPRDNTYIDFTSQSMLYALTGKKKPVYVNQSPLHIPGEFSQRMFIKQCEQSDVPANFALLGNSESLNGIRTNLRHYLLYEYLFENFRPFCGSTDNYYLWIRKDLFHIYNKKYFIEPQDNVRFKLPKPLMRSKLTDNNWNDGISKSNPTIMLFDAASPNSQLLANAKKIYSSNGEANVLEVRSFGDKWLHIIIDQSPHLFNTGILEIYGKQIVGYPIDYNYRDQKYHTYNMGDIPYIWGTFDKKIPGIIRLYGRCQVKPFQKKVNRLPIIY